MILPCLNLFIISAYLIQKSYTPSILLSGMLTRQLYNMGMGDYIPTYYVEAVTKII